MTKHRQAVMGRNLKFARALAQVTANEAQAASVDAESHPIGVAVAQSFRGFEATAHRLQATVAVNVADQVEAWAAEQISSNQECLLEAQDHWRQFGPRGVVSKCTFENFEVVTAEQQSALNAAVRFGLGAPGEAQTLVLAGKPGTGKTHLLAATFRERFGPSSYFGCHWIDAPVLLRTLADAKGDRLERLLQHFGDGECDVTSSFDEDFQRRTFGAQFLAIDDFGAGEFPASCIDLFGEVMHRRNRAGLTTLISTNLGKASLEAYAGGRCNSRINESLVRCGFTGRDMRPEKHPERSAAPEPQFPRFVEAEARARAALARSVDERAELRTEARAALAHYKVARQMAGAAVASVAPQPAITAAQVSERTVAAARKFKADVIRILTGYGAKRGADVRPDQWAQYLGELDALDSPRECPLDLCGPPEEINALIAQG